MDWKGKPNFTFKPYNFTLNIFHDFLFICFKHEQQMNFYATTDIYNSFWI